MSSSRHENHDANRDAKRENPTTKLGLKEIYNLNYVEFVEAIKTYIPESNYLNEDAYQSLASPVATTTAPTAPTAPTATAAAATTAPTATATEAAATTATTSTKATKATDKGDTHFYGFTGWQAIRGYGGLLAFKDVYNGTEAAYLHLITCQKTQDKPVLTKEKFDELHAIVHKEINTEERLKALTWSILCNDLCQVKKIKALYDSLSKPAIGHDRMLAEVLSNEKLSATVSEMFPAFSALSKQSQADIIAGYASGCDPSQLEEGELPMIAMLGLMKLNKNAFILYLWHSVFDVAGAVTHLKLNDKKYPTGSSTLHQDTCCFFLGLIKILDLRDQGASIETMHAAYLTFRGQYSRDNKSKPIGIPNNSAENTALLRIICLARIATAEETGALLSVWNKLDPNLRKVLIDELSIPGNKGKRAIFVPWGVAIINNPVWAVEAAGIERVIALTQKLEIGLTVMAQLFRKTRKKISSLSNAVTDSYYVAFCSTIAGELKKITFDIRQHYFKFTATTNDDNGIPRRSIFVIAPKNVLEEKSTLSSSAVTLQLMTSVNAGDSKVQCSQPDLVVTTVKDNIQSQTPLVVEKFAQPVEKEVNKLTAIQKKDEEDASNTVRVKM